MNPIGATFGVCVVRSDPCKIARVANQPGRAVCGHCQGPADAGGDPEGRAAEAARPADEEARRPAAGAAGRRPLQGRLTAPHRGGQPVLRAAVRAGHQLRREAEEEV